MQYGRKYIVLGLIIISTVSAYAQPLVNVGELFSPTAALTFYDIAKELIYVGPGKTEISDAQAQQAMIFLTAATKLDNQSEYILEDMLLLACNDSSILAGANLFEIPKDPNSTNGRDDNLMLVQTLLSKYVNNRCNLTVCRKAVQYLLSKCDNREQKEMVLGRLYKTIENKNETLASEIAVRLGALAAERADYENAANYYVIALSKNNYNRLAFEKIIELVPEQVDSSQYTRQLRYFLREDPLNLQIALAYAQKAQQGEVFQVASDAYQYCADLFTYLYPDKPLPQYIYLPLALCSYNTERNPHEAIDIADKIRTADVLDIMLEAVAAKAALRIGDTEKANSILDQAEQKALDRYLQNSENPLVQQNIAQQLGWFYSFARIDKDKSIEWTNKAYAAEPNSPTAAALLAYAFILNEQPDMAQAFIETYQPSQVMNLVKANIQLASDERDSAVETLRGIIASAPETIEAQNARQKLNEIAAEYIPQTDPTITLNILESTFGAQVVPVFMRPDQMIEYQLKIKGDKFYYGQTFDASLVITNRSNEDIIISDSSLLQGNIRIDVAVRGDLMTKIPNLISKKVAPSQHIKPNSSLLIPLRLATGKLKNILNRYPQADLDIEITAYLDPVTLQDGSVGNRLEGIKPYVKTFERPALEMNSQFLRNRMNSLKRRMQSHKTAELFSGLLIEQNIMANQEPLYKFMYADWIPDILKSGLVYNLTTDDWSSRVYTMSSMKDLPLDFELIEAVSGNLNSEYWPARMMSLYLLAQNRNNGFNKVLDHTAQFDPDNMVRTMAIALGGKVPSNKP